MSLKDLKNYVIIEERKIKELDSLAFLMEHKKTKAKILILENDDENNSFAIGFRTPQENSKGLPHIIEHSVLCGSKKFPVKEPFVELMKASLNTFLNAMTFSDKTVYPISSCNQNDFHNLVDVYLDAVLNPNIYSRKEIFLQEGWHYELEDKDAPLIYNGVVYNEMKGAFSSPERVLASVSQNAMFTDNCYHYESGGDPKEIIKLTQKEFEDFHSKYYHPSNSYIVLYGNGNFEEMLSWIDEEYLSKYEYKKVDSIISKQKDFEKEIYSIREYPIGIDEESADKAFMSYNYLIGTSNDALLWMGFTILSYVLFDAPGAIIKQALLDAGLGKDIYSRYNDDLLQPLFSICAKAANLDKQEEFKEVIKGTLKKVVKEGINKKTLLAAINYMEFKYREANFYGTPKGIMYTINLFGSWLYDENDPFSRLETDKLFNKLRELINDNYFEDLVEKYLIDNKNCGLIIVKPNKGLGQVEDSKVKEDLKNHLNSLNDKEIEELIKQTKELKKYQSSPSTKEELSTIPLLSRKDLNMKVPEVINKEIYVDDVLVVNHEYFTNEIGYLNILFDITGMKNELLPYVGILTSLLENISTKKYSYQDIDTEVNLNSGGVSFSTKSFYKNEECAVYLVASSSVLYDKIDFSFNMIQEILNNTLFDNKKRIKEVLFAKLANMQRYLVNAGHVATINRAFSYIDEKASYEDLINGISAYQVLEKVYNNFDKEYDDLCKKMQSLSKMIFRKDNFFISYTSTFPGLEKLVPFVLDFKNSLSDETKFANEFKFTPNKLNEGFKTSSNVQYVARVGNFKKFGYKFNGALNVLKNALSTDYLWVKVRVLGGAYGCMCMFSRTGAIAFTSYRDPNIVSTNDVYNNVIEFIKNFKADEEEMTKYIIGAVGEFIAPLTPMQKGQRALNCYFTGLKTTDYEQELKEMINCTEDDVKALEDLFRSVLDENALCVIGNESKIEECKELFNNTLNLVK